MITVLSVFWYYKDKFYGVEAPMQSKHAIAYGDYLQLDYDHINIWDKAKRDMGIRDSFVDYIHVPRGRILFHIPTHHYIVIGSKAIINNEKVKDALLRWYNLPANTEFRGDEHYG